MSDSVLPDRADRLALYLSVGVFAFGAIITVISTVARLVEVAAGSEIPVTVPLSDMSVGLPLGPNGSDVTAQVDSATILVSDPAPATLFALWAQPIWLALTVLAGLALASVFVLRVARGQVFTRGAVRLAMAGAFLIAIGWAGSLLFTSIATNGSLATVGEGTYDAVSIPVSLAPFLVFLFLGALGIALQIGERLQRETEGLV